MTDDFYEFMKWSHLDESGYRRINDDTPKPIIEKIKEAESRHYKTTGRHIFILD